MEEELINRLTKEFTDFLKEKEQKTMDVPTAYELVIKSEIIDAIEYDFSLEDEDIEKLLNFKGNLLDYFYNEWIDWDVGNLRETLINPIQHGIDYM